MKIRQLGVGGPASSAIGLGCMRMTSIFGSERHDDDSGIATIHAALDAGINLLDTGDFYGMGENEMLIGRALKGRRDDAVISVKFGVQRGAASLELLGFDGRPNSVKAFAAYSLRRLGVDVIDIYQPARVDPDVPIEDTVGAIADLIRDGKVRFLGLSEPHPEIIRRAHAVHPVTALEVEYSLAERFIEPEILPIARELGIGIVAYSVLTQGLLAGSITGPLSASDPRRMFPRFEDANLLHNLGRVAVFNELAAAKGVTPAQIAIAWVLSRGDDIVPLVGMSRPTLVAENLGAFEVQLSPDEMAQLDRTFAPGSIIGDRWYAQVKHLQP